MKLKDSKWVKWVLGTVGAIVAGSAIMLGGVMVGYPAISQLVGLAVAQSSTLWNNVIDAAKGDSQSSGILGMSSYLWNGTTFDRQKGTSGSANVNLVGAITPADAYANPTTASQVWNLNGIFNGTTWDRQRSATADTLASTGITAVGNMVFNGTTWNRWRGSVTNGALVEKKTVGTSFFAVKRIDITTASVNLAYGFTSRKIMISTPSGNTAVICVDWTGGTAICPAANTAGDGTLEAGTSLVIDDYAGTSISVIAAAGTQIVNVMAWN